MTNQLHTPQEWTHLTGIVIHDPDGWRTDGKSFDDPLTFSEFERRAMASTIDVSRMSGVFHDDGAWVAYVEGRVVASGPDKPIVAAAYEHHSEAREIASHQGSSPGPHDPSQDGGPGH